jgi:hypothetical protein
MNSMASNRGSSSRFSGVSVDVWQGRGAPREWVDADQHAGVPTAGKERGGVDAADGSRVAGVRSLFSSPTTRKIMAA